MASAPLRHLVPVAVGGACGGLLRYAVDLAAPPEVGDFPWGTFTVNVLGCFLLAALVARIGTDTTLYRVLGSGVLGGFTTMSAYAEQTRSLLDSGHEATALLYVTGTLAAALLAVVLATRLVRR